MPRASRVDNSTRNALARACKGTGVVALLLVAAYVWFVAIERATGSPLMAFVLGYSIVFVASIFAIRPR